MSEQAAPETAAPAAADIPVEHDAPVTPGEVTAVEAKAEETKKDHWASKIAAFEKEKARIESKAKALADFEAWQKEFEADPWEALAKKGVNTTEVLKRYIEKTSEPPKSKEQLEAEEAKTKYEKLLQEEQERQQQAQYNQARDKYLGEIKTLVSDESKFDILPRIPNGAEYVWELVVESNQRFGKPLPFAEAADKVEQFFDDFVGEFQKIVEKTRKYGKKQEEPKVDAAPVVVSTSEKPKTSKQRPLSEDERLALAAAAFGSKK